MSDFNPDVNQTDDCCLPCDPCPVPTTQEECIGELTGSITGAISMPCCCPRLYTRTFVLNIGPQTEPTLLTFLQGTVTAWETSGYLVLGHSTTDIGAGWKFSFTVGWYA